MLFGLVLFVPLPGAANTHDCHTHAALDQHDQARAAWHQAQALVKARQRTNDLERIRHQLSTSTDDHRPQWSCSPCNNPALHRAPKAKPRR
ncbi:hypothetical protein ACFQ1S_04685 [Kibdelosporangium lantanae]|uniref:Secreted protein n=1 Tax=Kibdelosporangium lantanae TaxID=1497396 RepID=A0ABW3M2N5_9PSEU